MMTIQIRGHWGLTTVLILLASLQLSSSPVFSQDGPKVDVSVQAGQPEAAVSVSANSVDSSSEVANKVNAFKNLPFYLDPYEPDMKPTSEVAAEFDRNRLRADIELLKQITIEAIERRNKLGNGVAMMLKYSGKLLGQYIRSRQAELRLVPKREPKSSFFEMIATMVEQVLDKSKALKSNYNKNNVETGELLRRLLAVFDYIQKIVDNSPYGAYLKWDSMVLFKGDTNLLNKEKNTIDELGDIVAQLRVLGYDSCTFVARRVVNLLRLFSRGVLPSEKEV